MDININSDYRITSDPMNIILQKKKVTKEGGTAKVVGKGYWINIGYFPNLEQAFKRCVDYEIMSSDLEGVIEIKKHLSKIHKDIENVMKCVKG